MVASFDTQNLPFAGEPSPSAPVATTPAAGAMLLDENPQKGAPSWFRSCELRLQPKKALFGSDAARKQGG